MINESDEPSSACRLWRISQVETSTPPLLQRPYYRPFPAVGQAKLILASFRASQSEKRRSLGKRSASPARPSCFATVQRLRLGHEKKISVRCGSCVSLSWSCNIL